ncbi:MAG: nuclear transport factor 2 family protein [Candidatus Eisenbacteria bacterium]
MTESEIRLFYDDLMAGRADRIAERLDEHVILEFPGRRFGGRYAGRRAVLVFLKQNQRLFRGGLRFDVEWAAVAGDRAVAQWSNEGTTRAGEAYRNRGVTVFRFRGESIVEIQDYLDTEAIAETWPGREGTTT